MAGKGAKKDSKLQIQEKLRALGAKVTGSKQELEERLINWQKGNLSRRLVTSQVTPPISQKPLPPPEEFRPIAEYPKAIFKKFTSGVIDVWFEDRKAAGSKSDGKRLCYCKFLKGIEVAAENSSELFFKCKCSAETRKSVDYNVSLVFNRADSQITQAGCTCPAGKGFSVACKHVGALAYAIEHYEITKEVQENVACTSQLQKWHKPATAPGRGLRPCTISEIIKKPLDKCTITDNASTDTLLNMLISSHCSSPALYSRCVNAEGYFNDWNGVCCLPLEILVQDQVNFLSPSEIKLLEKRSRSQSSSREWKRARSSRITASMAGACVRTVRTGNLVKGPALRQVSPPKMINSKSLKWGRSNEPVAINEYKTVMGLEVKKCGLFVDSEICYLAGTPDGITSDDTLVEVKCPYTVRDERPENTPFLKKSTVNGFSVTSLQRNHSYYMQCQLQMHVTRCKRCDFVVWTNEGIFTELIRYDPDFCERAIFYLDQYYRLVFAPLSARYRWSRK